MTALQRRFYRVYFKADDGGGAGVVDENEPISFGEAFGVNIDGTPYEPESGETPPAEEEEEEEEENPTPPGESGAETPAATPPAGETPDQVVERLYAGKYKSVEELEKAHKELTAAWDSRGPATPPPAPAEPEQKAPQRLLRGEVGEIKTEADLYNLATTDPEAAAQFAMDNYEALSDEQFETVMNAWIAQQPLKAITSMQRWQADQLREEFAERQRVQDEHYVNTMRDQGIELAVKAQPLLAPYINDLGTYIEEHPQLNTMIEGARTAEELSHSIQAVFYMMAGPELSQQALTARVAAEVKAREKAAADAAAAEAAADAGSITRSNGVPPGSEDDYDEKMRQKILNPRSS